MIHHVVSWTVREDLDRTATIEHVRELLTGLVGTIGSIPYLANGGILSRGSAIVGEAGPELLTVAAGRSIVQPLSPSAASWQPSAPGGTAGEGITYKDMLNVANVIVQAIENNGAEVVIGDDVIYRSYNRARDSEAIVRGGLR